MRDILTSGKFKVKVPWTLILVFVVFTIGILLLGYIFYRSQRERLVAERRDNLEAISSLKIDQIIQWYNERISDATVISHNMPLVLSIKRFIDGDKNTDLPNDLKSWMQSVAREYDYGGVLLIDTSFNVRLTVFPSDTLAGDVIGPDLHTAISKDTILITDLHSGHQYGHIHMDLIVPVSDKRSENSKPFAVLILRINPEKVLFPLIKSWPLPSLTSETLIFREEGDSILFINELRHMDNTAMALKLPASRKKLLAAQALRGSEGMYEGVDYRDVPVVGYLSSIPGLPWYMVAKIDKQELEAPLRVYLLVTIIVAVLLVLINASVFVFWIWDQRVKAYKSRLSDQLALRESEAKFTTAFQMSPVSISLVRFDDNTVIDVNNTFLEKSGYKYEEVVGKNFGDLKMWASEDERNWTTNELNKSGKISGKELRYKSKDGRILYGLSSMSLIKIKEEPCILSIVIDVTENKYAEKLIKESEQRLNSAVAHAPLPIMIHAEDGEVIMLNSTWTEFTGYSQNEIRNVKDWTERAYGNRKELVESEIERLYSMTEKIYEGEYSVNTKNGEIRIWDFMSAPLGQMPDGRRMVISMAMDTTERKQALIEIEKLNRDLEVRVLQRTEQLEASNKELEAFSYSVSHDLRSPLRAIHGYTKILYEDYFQNLDAEGKRICDIISSSATTMGTLIDDLLRFSKLGRLAIKPVLIDMKLLAENVFSELLRDLNIQNIEYEIGPLHNSYGDATLISLVWNNLLSNAVKYSSSKEFPKISVGSVAEGKMTHYFVRDNGVGFNMLYVNKLFGVFQRLHNSFEFEGNGVGLAIVHRVVTKHGGKTWAEGEEGLGATFWFSLPVIENDGKMNIIKS